MNSSCGPGDLTGLTDPYEPQKCGILGSSRVQFKLSSGDMHCTCQAPMQYAARHWYDTLGKDPDCSEDRHQRKVQPNENAFAKC